jgi:hypothetical protein
MLSVKRALFGAGLAGAWSFPPLVPLAFLDRPPERAELRELAEKLRSLLGGKKISGLAWTDGVFPGGATVSSAPMPAFWGAALDMPPPLSIVEGTKNALPFDRAVLVAALVRNSGAVPSGDLPDPGGISFRAAALAFMLLAPLEALQKDASEKDEAKLSFTWELDEPVWLPNPKRSGRG